MENSIVNAIMDVTIKDRDKIMEYVLGHKASMQQYGGKLLFRRNDMEVVEGNWRPKLLVVHEWPSEDALKNWDNSKEYAPWKKLRKDAMDMNMVLARKMSG
jgi:uncharacterized protein (DUF1330 family)